jgi:hypothetical protein
LRDAQKLLHNRRTAQAVTSATKLENKMITATYMAASYEFRPEYLKQEGIASGYVGIDPIDAPDVISAGYHYSAKAITSNHCYPLPACIIRTEY